MERYPRTARVNEVVREVLAEELERMSDPRLELVTVTGVDVSPDLKHARVYYTTVDVTDETAAEREEHHTETANALSSARRHLQAKLGREVRLKYVPRLAFEPDPAIEQGRRIDSIIRDLHDEDDGPDEEGRDEEA